MGESWVPYLTTFEGSRFASAETFFLMRFSSFLIFLKKAKPS
jgi:hypothetical protein